MQMIVAERNYDKELEANKEQQRDLKGKPKVREVICLMRSEDATELEESR